MSKMEIDFKSTTDCDITIDGEPVNGMSAVEIDIKAGHYPKVKLVPAVTELQFGSRAAVDAYVGHMEAETARWILQALQNHLGIVDPETIGDKVTANEALLSFTGWLTARPETIRVGGGADVATMVELYSQFADANDLLPPRDCWPGNVVPVPVVEPQQLDDELSGD